MKKLTIAALSVLVLAAMSPALAGGPRHYPRGRHAAGPAQQASFRVGLGLFTPDGGSDFFDANKLEFTGEASDLEDASLTAELLWPAGRLTSLHLTLGAFEGETRQAYLDFVDEGGFDIVHDSRLSIAPVTLGLLLRPLPGADRISPYVGAGLGFYFWDYEEVGDFIAFDEFGDPVEIITTGFGTDGVAFGYYLLAGLDVPLTPEVSVFGEARWQEADDDLADDFSGLGEIDLSGRDLRLGVAWRF